MVAREIASKHQDSLERKLRPDARILGVWSQNELKHDKR